MHSVEGCGRLLRNVGVHGVSATLNGVMCKKTRILTNSHVKHSKLSVGSKTVSILILKHVRLRQAINTAATKIYGLYQQYVLRIYCKLICIYKTSVTKQNILLRTEYNSK